MKLREKSEFDPVSSFGGRPLDSMLPICTDWQVQAMPNR